MFSTVFTFRMARNTTESPNHCHTNSIKIISQDRRKHLSNKNWVTVRDICPQINVQYKWHTFDQKTKIRTDGRTHGRTDGPIILIWGHKNEHGLHMRFVPILKYKCIWLQWIWRDNGVRWRRFFEHNNRIDITIVQETQHTKHTTARAQLWPKQQMQSNT